MVGVNSEKQNLMPLAPFALRDGGFLVPAKSRDDREATWLFDACARARAAPCIAFRAIVYARTILKTGDAGRAVVREIDDAFARQPPCGPPECAHPEYPLPVAPFWVHCLWIAAKIESQYWGAAELGDIVFSAHWKALCIRNRCEQFLRIQQLEFLVCEALDWRLVPRSPFVCLSDLDDEAKLELPVTRVMCADDMIHSALVFGVEANSDLLAVAALAAAAMVERGLGRSDRDVARALECMVTMASAPRHFHVAFADAFALCALLEDRWILSGANPTTTQPITPRKRPREAHDDSTDSADAPSPTSVIA